MEKLFKLRENHTNVKTEIIAGITTFMAMAYILAVNPNILSSTGMDKGAVFTATALASLVGTLCMALFAWAIWMPQTVQENSAVRWSSQMINTLQMQFNRFITHQVD